MQRRPLLEAAVVTAWTACFLWFGRQLFPGASVLFGGLLLAGTMASHRWAGESARDIGLRRDTAAHAAAFLLPLVLLVALALVLGAPRNVTPLWTRWLNERRLWQLAPFIASGVLQQYLLLGFLLRRCSEALPTWRAVFVTTLVFAALHMPNAFLVAVTLVAGWLSCLIYRRAPNLVANGIAHGVIVYLLYSSLPAQLHGGMRVGIDYLQHRGL